MSDTKKKYIPKDSSGNDYAALSGMSQLHKAALEAAGAAWNEAQAAGDQAGMDAAHQKAETIRGLYGYSGGGDGSEFIPAASQETPAAFSYASAPAYVSRYQGQIDALTSQLLGRAPFQYDPEQDPAYQQYRESYTRAGQRTMEDTLGQLSARTGGLASSFAGTAAQQTYDGYMSALADKIPELRQLAYSMYQQEGEQQRANLAMLTGLEQGDYSRYLNQLGQYNTDRSFAYGVYGDRKSDAYQALRDRIADERYAEQTAYDREQDARQAGRYASQTQYSQAMDKAETLAGAGDFSGYAALGYSPEEIAGLQTAWNRQQAALRASGGSGSGSGSGSAAQAGAGVYQQLYDAGVRSYDDAYAALRAAGYSADDANRYARGLVNKLQAGDFAPAAMAPDRTDSAAGDLYGDLFGRLPGSLFSSRRDQFLAQADQLYRPGDDLTSLDWSQDEGVFRWNGRTYSSAEQLAQDILAAGLSQEQLALLDRKLAMFGL